MGCRQLLIRLKLRRPTTLAEAVASILRGNGESCPASWERDGLLERAARLLNATEDEIGAQAAKLLRLPFSSDLATPSIQLIATTGYSAIELERRMCLPQPSPIARAGYVLITAFPEDLNVRAFREAGIPVHLGSTSGIRRAWDGFFGRAGDRASGVSPHVLGPAVVAVLHRAVTDCERAGASEVFLGHPGDDQFECMTPEGRWGGAIHPEVLRTVKAIVSSDGRIDIDRQALERAVGRTPFESFELGLTRSFDGPVVYVAWTPRPTRVPPAAVKSRIASGALIAVIDDDERFATLVSTMLTERGYRVRPYSSVASFLSMLAGTESPPDLVLCDVHMPAGNCFDVLQSIRTCARPPAVLIVTSDDSPAREALLVVRGVDAFVRKQECPEVLLAWVSNLIAKRSGEPMADA